MWLLALDTTTRGGSVALVRDDAVLVEHAGAPEENHVARLPGAVDAVLAEAGVAASAIDVWAVASGPGGFTGLRVGLATVQGFAFAFDRPAVGVPTLEAAAWWHAERTPGRTHVGAWLDAFRGEVFAAAYAVSGQDGLTLAEVCEPLVATPGAVAAAWASRLPAGTAIVGAVGPAFGPPAAASGLVGVAPPAALAGVVGRLAWRAHRQGRSGPPHALAPLYIRRPDAVVERERRRGLTSAPP